MEGCRCVHGAPARTALIKQLHSVRTTAPPDISHHDKHALLSIWTIYFGLRAILSVSQSVSQAGVSVSFLLSLRLLDNFAHCLVFGRIARQSLPHHC